jgi:hypothetical protein
MASRVDWAFFFDDFRTDSLVGGELQVKMDWKRYQQMAVGEILYLNAIRNVGPHPYIDWILLSGPDHVNLNEVTNDD